MEPSPVSTDPEKATEFDEPVSPHHDLTNRAVAFGPEIDDTIDTEHRDRDRKDGRPRGVELGPRVMTQEDKELAAAGYGHLDHAKKEGGKEADDGKLGNVDITEHGLPIAEVAEVLGTSFEVKDPAASVGLTVVEAGERLKRDGPNALTPPKKKTVLQKVRFGSSFSCGILGNCV